jgi:hypothetical protein
MDQTLILSVGLFAVFVAMVITLYDMGTSLKPAACPECAHCRAIAAAAAREQERLDREYARRIGLADEDDDRRID